MGMADAFTQPVASNIPPPYEHQEATTKFVLDHLRSMVFNDPGTGKTRSVLDAIVEIRQLEPDHPVIVLAPKSILVPAWYNDAAKFTPDLKLSIATAKNRMAAFKVEADVYVTNHDAAPWLLEHKKDLPPFGMVVIDESTAFKNRTAQRSKAIAKFIRDIQRRVIMTGTPIPNSVLDIWHQVLLADDGEHLGRSFFAFRQAVCEPMQVGPQPNMIEWRDKEGAADVVAEMLSDISIRYRFDECISIPPNTMHTVEFDLPPALREQYDEMVRTALLALDSGEITAVNAAAQITKLLQIASGAVYDGAGIAHDLDDGRTELITQLVDERKHCLIAFLWRHQRDRLRAAFEKAGFTVATLDGDTPDKQRPLIVDRFQGGKYRVLLAHPQSASHGLTLTKGTTTIWASPTFDAERFHQFNKRIDRAGQTERTETILVQARATIEPRTYERVLGKLTRQDSLLEFVRALR